MKLFQTYSGAAQRAYLGSGVIPVDYTGHSGTEYELFKQIQSASAGSDEAWGLVSWKFEVKCHIGLDEFRQAASAQLAEGADCVFINPMIGAESVFSNVWEQGMACGHKGIELMIPFLLDRLYLRPADLFMPRSVFAFCNYFVAKPKFWQRYFDYVDSVLTDLELDAHLDLPAGRLLNGPSNYAKKPSLSMKPFIVERLFSSFVPQSGLIVRGIDLDLPIYKAKFGNLLGNTLHQLSRIKNQPGTHEDHTTAQRRWEQLSRKIIGSRSFLTLMHLDDPDLGIAEVGLAAA